MASRRAVLVLLFPLCRGMMLPDVVGIGKQLLHRHVPQDTWLETPVPLLPTTEEISQMPSKQRERRAGFYLSAFLLTYGATLLVGTAIMKLGPMLYSQRDVYEPMKNSADSSEDEDAESSPAGHTVTGSLSASHQRVLLATVFGANLACCLAAAIASLTTNRLSKTTGLDWEVYYLLFVMNCLWLLVQAAMAVLRLRGQRVFSLCVFAECTISGTWPIFSDAYDTLKDVLFGALCIQSAHWLLKLIGVASWMYLILIHLYFARDDNCVADLISCYLCVLMAPTTAAKGDLSWDQYSNSHSCLCLHCGSASETVLPLLYKQVTPTKRFLLLYENVPQSVFAIVYLGLEGGSILVALLNLFIPALQIFMTHILFMPLRMKVAPFFAKKLDQAVEDGNVLMEARILHETELCDDPQLLGAVLSHSHSWPGSGSLEVGFANGKLGESGARALTDGLTGCEQLLRLHLDIAGNRLGDEGAGMLGAALESCSHVEELVLCLGQIGLGPSAGELLGDRLSRCEKLAKLNLDLAGNSLRDRGATALAESLSRCPNLRTLMLRLSGNRITAKAAKELVAHLSRCERLWRLDIDLATDELKDEASGSLGQELPRSTSDPVLAFGGVSSSGAQLLSEYLARLRQLQSLILMPGGASAEESGTDLRVMGHVSSARQSRPHSVTHSNEPPV